MGCFRGLTQVLARLVRLPSRGAPNLALPINRVDERSTGLSGFAARTRCSVERVHERVAAGELGLTKGNALLMPERGEELGIHGLSDDRRHTIMRGPALQLLASR